MFRECCRFLRISPTLNKLVWYPCPCLHTTQTRRRPNAEPWLPQMEEAEEAGRPISNLDRNQVPPVGRVGPALPTHSSTRNHHLSLITMLPLFGTDDRKRRNINLGGRSSSSSHTSILDEARLRREERLSQLKRQQSAVRIQAWWRGSREARVVRAQLRHTLDQDPTGIDGLRSVVLIGQDEESLAIWSRHVLQSGESGWNVSRFACTEVTLF